MVDIDRAELNTSVERSANVELLWIPLGAGQRIVRASGRMFERLSSFLQRREPRDLYHSALAVSVPEASFVIEMAPTIDVHGDARGVVAAGPVGMKWAGRLRIFRYEIRRWRGGTIPDRDAAVATIKLEVEPHQARRLLELVSSVPTPVWGRDELGAGEMWNSNSVTSWLLSCAGIDTAGLGPPERGRAPVGPPASSLRHAVEASITNLRQVSSGSDW